MPRLPIIRLAQARHEISPSSLKSYLPTLSFEGLQLGIDNLRHDVYLSTTFVEAMRLHVARLIMRYGDVEAMIAADNSQTVQPAHFIGSNPAGKLGPGMSDKTRNRAETAELKPLLTELQVAALNRAKAEGNICVDLLVRAALIKFLRTELNSQFAQVLERCRVMLKSYEGVRPQKALEYRERVAAFQVAKKIIQRQAAQELFRTLREIEKETLLRTRRSFFGSEREAEYQLFLNPLVLSEDGRDPYLGAERYVMLGNFERDRDSFAKIRALTCRFLQSQLADSADEDAAVFDGWLSVPENSQELVGAGTPDESSTEGEAQRLRLAAWVKLLEQEKTIECVIASYEVVPLLSEYSPRINPQQLKNGLISREERDRVEKLIREHGKLSLANFMAAVTRAANCRGAERAKLAGRFLRDFILYHRDVRRLEVLNAALDSVNLIGNEKLRALSALNGTLYEFSSLAEHKPVEEKILRHVILKADVRDSSRLTRSLLERGMNPASYFSLNFYGPVNKLLQKYGAHKVFLEGDAIILSFLEREGDRALAVSKACVLAREMIEIVRGYNLLLERARLPVLELGIGISYQDSAPMYLMDGEQRIMISDALNESDRLSSCNRRVRKMIESKDTPFNVYAFQTADAMAVDNMKEGESAEDFILKYNLGGIRISEAAFHRLRQEISLDTFAVRLSVPWGAEDMRLFKGLVPLANDIFHSIVIRGSRIPQVDAEDLSLKRWTDASYYEVCSNPAVDVAIAAKAAGR
jgi:hypothetical protein